MLAKFNSSAINYEEEEEEEEVPPWLHGHVVYRKTPKKTILVRDFHPRDLNNNNNNNKTLKVI